MFDWIKKKKKGSQAAGGQKQSGGRSQPPEQATTPVEAADNTAEKLKKHQDGKLYPLVKYANSLPEELPPEGNESKGRSIMEKGLAIFGFGKDMADSATGVMGEIAKEGSKFESGLDITGLITGAIGSIVDIFKLIVNVRDLIKEKGDNPKTIADTGENLIGLIQSSTTTALSAFKVAGKFTKSIPVIGGILGAFGAILEFVPHLLSTVRAGVGRHRMGKQKESAKDALNTSGRAGGYLVTKKGKPHLDRKQAAIRRSFILQQLENIPNVPNREEMKKRTELQQELAALNEFFLTRELKHTSNKRARQGALDITGDVINFAGSLASIEPQVGAAVGTVLSLGVTAGKWGHKGFTFIKQKVRNRSERGTPQGTGASFIGKSQKSKDERRGALGEYMVQQIMGLDSHKIETLDAGNKKAEATAAIADYSRISKQISSMGIFYSVLMRSRDRKQMASRLAGSMSREGDSDSDRSGLISSMVSTDF